MNPLQQIPAKVRIALYWVGYVLGMVTQITTGVWVAIAAASPDVTQPLWLIITSVVIGILQTQLNLLAGSNVPSLQDAIDGDVDGAVVVAEPRDRGAVDVVTALLVVFLVVVILVVLGVLR